jgi:curved DNA-binding protein CbpA
MSFGQKLKNTEENSYSILGVNPNSTDVDIKIAYRRLVLYWHPDKNKHDIKLAEQNLKIINEAYSKIKTPFSRKQYNQILSLQRKINIHSHFRNNRNIWGKFWTWLTMLESNKK